VGFAALVAAGAVGTTTIPATASAPTGEATRTAYADATISTETVVVPMVFPVVGGVSYSDTFLVCRSGCTRKHLGQDLMSPRMRPLVAVFNGTLQSVKRESVPGDGNYLTLAGDNGWSANYLHMNNDTPGTDDGRGTVDYAFAPGIRSGLRVVQGQLLGWTGDSGNAESTGPHTHFELRKGEPWSGIVYNAKASLDRAWRLAAPQTAGPHPNGTVVRDARFGPAWLIDSGRKRLIGKGTLALNGYRLTDVVPVQKAEIDMYARGADVPIRDGLVVRGADGAHWVIGDGARIAVPTESLALIGVAPDRVRVADGESLARTPLAVEQTLPGPVRDGALLRLEGSSTLWLVQDGERHAVPDIPTLNSWGIAHQDAWTLPADTFGPVPTPAPSDSATPTDAPTSGPTLPLPVVPYEHRSNPTPSGGPTAAPPPADSTVPAGSTPDGSTSGDPRLGDVLRPRDGSLLREPTGVTWLVDDGEKRLIPSGKVLHAYAMGAVTKRPVWATTLADLPRGRDFP